VQAAVPGPNERKRWLDAPQNTACRRLRFLSAQRASTRRPPHGQAPGHVPGSSGCPRKGKKRRRKPEMLASRGTGCSRRHLLGFSFELLATANAQYQWLSAPFGSNAVAVSAIVFGTTCYRELIDGFFAFGDQKSMQTRVNEVLAVGRKGQSEYDYGTRRRFQTRGRLQREGKPLTAKPIRCWLATRCRSRLLVSCGEPATHFCARCSEVGEPGCYLCSPCSQPFPVHSMAAPNGATTLHVRRCAYDSLQDRPTERPLIFLCKPA
jgi:hypothetical protein